MFEDLVRLFVLVIEPENVRRAVKLDAEPLGDQDWVTVSVGDIVAVEVVFEDFVRQGV